MTLKKLSVEHFNQSYQLAQYAFRFADDQQHRDEFYQLMKHSTIYGAFYKQQLASQVIATPLKVQLFHQVIDMAGIGLVSSDPSFRGQGNIDQLMQQMLEDCYQNGVILSYLDPFSYPFYRRYGYELVFERICYDIESQNWPDSPKASGYVRRMDWKNAKEDIKRIDQKSDKHKHGGVLREDWWYDYKFKEKTNDYFAVYYNQQDQPEGYLIYQIENGKLLCIRWLNLTLEAYQGLNRYIASHCDSTERIIFEKGYDRNENFFLHDRPINQATIRPEMMARIVDIQTFLKKYPLKNLEESFAITIENDPYASWNEGTFELIKEEQVDVRRVTSTQLPELKISVQRFTQLFLGYLSVNDLIFHEFVIVDEKIVDTIKQLTPQKAPVLEDYF